MVADLHLLREQLAAEEAVAAVEEE